MLSCLSIDENVELIDQGGEGGGVRAWRVGVRHVAHTNASGSAHRKNKKKLFSWPVCEGRRKVPEILYTGHKTWDTRKENENETRAMRKREQEQDTSHKRRTREWYRETTVAVRSNKENDTRKRVSSAMADPRLIATHYCRVRRCFADRLPVACTC